MDVAHRFVTTKGVRLHVAEQGQGYPVVFCHGFPHTWYVWHRQMEAVAKAGFHALALDMRGYGRTDIPDDADAYTNEAVIGDLLALLDDIGAEQAVFVGLDFGAALLWELALRAPERVRGLVVLNNPFTPRSPRVPSSYWSKMAEKHFLHLEYFREPGIADAALAAHPREFLARVYYALSGDYHYLDTWQNPPGISYLEALPQAPALPWSWLSTDEFDTLAAEFERTGFTGGLSWYRAIDRNWELTADFAGATVTLPVYFVYGENDPDMEGFSGRDPLDTMRAYVPDLRSVEKVNGAGHLVQLERADAVNAFLLSSLADLGVAGALAENQVESA
ncbi:alpha/beta fold hydrolase [Nocardia cyriacigeorgica]|uniref:alpha/beta fold hydrolase n=1 Tax=Nocardia cyriacigeorgica TaxID=135487 RepID=UPI0028112758|nr:alpha/beta hydrolase [Nocardia cyriacigeorgica]